jgi:DNA-binding transcriptional MerR regulator
VIVARVAETLTTGELAKRGRTTLRTIRYYEAEGLLSSDRTEGGHRVFTDEALARLQLIQDLRSLDFSIEQIRVLLDNLERARKPGAIGLDDRKDMLIQIAHDLEDKLKETEERLKVVERVHREFYAALQVLQGCGPCSEAPGGPVCPTCHNLVSRPHSGLIDVLYEIQGRGEPQSRGDLVRLGPLPERDGRGK